MKDETVESINFPVYIGHLSPGAILFNVHLNTKIRLQLRIPGRTSDVRG